MRPGAATEGDRASAHGLLAGRELMQVVDMHISALAHIEEMHREKEKGAGNAEAQRRRDPLLAGRAREPLNGFTHDTAAFAIHWGGEEGRGPGILSTHPSASNWSRTSSIPRLSVSAWFDRRVGRLDW